MVNEPWSELWEKPVLPFRSTMLCVLEASIDEREKLFSLFLQSLNGTRRSWEQLNWHVLNFFVIFRFYLYVCFIFFFFFRFSSTLKSAAKQLGESRSASSGEPCQRLPATSRNSLRNQRAKASREANSTALSKTSWFKVGDLTLMFFSLIYFNRVFFRWRFHKRRRNRRSFDLRWTFRRREL